MLNEDYKDMLQSLLDHEVKFLILDNYALVDVKHLEENSYTYQSRYVVSIAPADFVSQQ